MRPSTRTVFLCIAISAATGAATAADPVARLRDLEDGFVRVAKQVSPSVVAIETTVAVRKRDIVPMVGSGVIVDSAGLIVTNDHVIRGADVIHVALSDGSEYEAEVVGRDPRSDLAVIRIPRAGLKPAVMTRLEEVNVGQWALAMGNPFGLASLDGRSSLSYGIVSALGKSLPELEQSGMKYYGNMIQTTAHVNPGNSGGGLFSLDGRLIGINTAIETSSGVSEGVAFAIPITSRTRRIIEQLKAGNEIEYGFLGVTVAQAEAKSIRDLPSELGRAIEVTRIHPDTPAARAQLQENDVIVTYRDIPVKSVAEIVRLIQATPVGDTVDLFLYRDTRPMTVSVTLEKKQGS